MPNKTQAVATLRFGVFELDLRAGELRKKGVRIKLQEQPFQVLTVLLQHPGEVASREQLRSAIWPTDTFVDFDNGLNTAINKLRDALGDSPGSPRFIETLPRRGYRFIAPVTSEDEKQSSTLVNGVSRTQRSKIVMLVSLFLVAGLLAGGLVWHGRQAHHLTEQDTVILGDFANSTGDGVFDGTLRQGFAIELEQSPYLSLVSEERIHQTLRMMGRQANTPVTPEIVREVCQRTSSAAALEGSIALIGTRYSLTIRAVNCATGDSLASADAQANDKSHVLDALGNVASQMRRKLGESLSTVQKYNTPLVQATTPSLEALQAFNFGWNNLMGEVDPAAALPFFQRATQLDPNFAMAYWGMSLAYSELGETALSAENVRKAFSLREQLSDLEKLSIECQYYGDPMRARGSCELGAQTYPRDPFFHFDLGAYSNFLGQYESALKEYRESLRLAPYGGNFYRNVAFTYLLLDRVEDAENAAREAHTKELDSKFAPILYGIAFYRDDTAGMARQVAIAAGKPGDEGLLFAFEGDTAAYSGHLRKAREFSRRAADSAEQAGAKEAAATYKAVAALREALFGNAANAQRLATDARRRSSGRDMDYGVALAFACAGADTVAQLVADDLEKRSSDDTVVQFNYLPTLRAKLAMSHSKPQQALDALEVAATYEDGLPAIGYYNWPNLYPVYVRGEAYLAAHQGSKAAAEFQKILDHRGVVLNEPIGALAHLQIGRAYAMAGDTTKAKVAYQDFLTLWKDADPDIPILKQAKAEYAKLQ